MKPYEVQALPPAELDLAPLIPQMGRANRALAAYAGVLLGVPDPRVLLSPMTTEEAVLSSRIEGTQATLAEVLRFEAGDPPGEPSRERDIQEILNYRRALRAAEAELPQRRFSLSMLCGLHAILLAGVRGEDRNPGRFRARQNWIGPDNTPLEQAVFIPPAAIQVPGHMADLETYYHSDQPDYLAQLAVVHAQFEIIHPFEDGNGRIGRILIPLFLFDKGLLHRPMFYLSSWLERNRDEYVSRLRALGRTHDSWNAWVGFFLRGVAEQADLNAGKAQKILRMYVELKARVIELTHSQFAIPLLDQIFERLIFRRRDLDFGNLSPSIPTVISLLNALRDAGILTVLAEGAGRRGTVYAQADLVRLCEGRRVP